MNDALNELIAEREKFIALSRILLSALEENRETLLRVRPFLLEEEGILKDVQYQLEDNDAVVIRARKDLVRFPS